MRKDCQLKTVRVLVNGRELQIDRELWPFRVGSNSPGNGWLNTEIVRRIPVTRTPIGACVGLWFLLGSMCRLPDHLSSIPVMPFVLASHPEFGQPAPSFRRNTHHFLIQHLIPVLPISAFLLAWPHVAFAQDTKDHYQKHRGNTFSNSNTRRVHEQRHLFPDPTGAVTGDSLVELPRPFTTLVSP
ncbi:hypothetical protein ARMSODRAFT_975130 [Armillaria solidipes]|uniref:Uncharacterized protein n=1 Tax=Armillaria solidipes TaxID=1076256 RepID=A0A2H3BIB1_9AGAR|nr:hypothetical protein ARMSODRAFT_975130 [Armillaria solidipes]